MEGAEHGVAEVDGGALRPLRDSDREQAVFRALLLGSLRLVSL
jgi:hypothetical protein